MGDTISSLLFQPPPPTKLKAEKVIWLESRRGIKVPAFYISYSNIDGADVSRSLTLEQVKKSRPSEGITVLYSHANAEDLGSIYPWCKYLSRMLHVNLMAYDYAGYGMAYDQGPPSEKHCYADIEAAYDFLRNTLRVPATNIVLYGRSLGSGPSCHLAAGKSQLKEPVGGVILHAPFLSVFRIVLDSGCTLIGDKFPNVDLVPMIESPILFVHGTADQIVPVYHSQQLHSAVQKNCRVEPLFIDGMTHNNVHVAVRQLFISRLMDFLEKNIIPNASIEKSENTLRVKLKYSNRKKTDECETSPNTLELQQ